MDVKVDIESFRERTAGDKDLAMDLLSCFEDGLTEYQSQMMSYVERNEYESLANVLHKLKGAVGIFGFDNILCFILNFEMQAKTKSVSDGQMKVKCLFDSIDEHILELKKIINN